MKTKTKTMKTKSNTTKPSGGTRPARRIRTRYAGHCYATTYHYLALEEMTPRKKGNGSFWKKVAQWGRRCGAGNLHTGWQRHNLPVESFAESFGMKPVLNEIQQPA